MQLELLGEWMDVAFVKWDQDILGGDYSCTSFEWVNAQIALMITHTGWSRSAEPRCWNATQKLDD